MCWKHIKDRAVVAKCNSSQRLQMSKWSLTRKLIIEFQLHELVIMDV